MTTTSTSTRAPISRGFHIVLMLLLLVSLAIGAGGTVAIAWWKMPSNPLSGALGTRVYQGPGVLDGVVRMFDVSEGSGFTRVMAQQFHGLAPSPGTRLELNLDRLPSWSIIKPWKGDLSPPAPSSQDPELIEEYASGWPMRSLVARRRGSVMIPMNQRTTEGIWYGATKLVQPTTPIWPGFLTDSIVLSSPLWLACGLLCAHRAGLFRRAYQCKSCGYDLRGQTSPGCPECGAGRHLPTL